MNVHIGKLRIVYSHDDNRQVSLGLYLWLGTSKPEQTLYLQQQKTPPCMFSDNTFDYGSFDI